MQARDHIVKRPCGHSKFWLLSVSFPVQGDKKNVFSFSSPFNLEGIGTFASKWISDNRKPIPRISSFSFFKYKLKTSDAC